MKIEHKALEGCKRQLDIEIPSEIVKNEMARASDEMAKYARVPGFRPGKVPRSVIRQRYKTELEQETLRTLLPSAVDTAVEQHKLRVVGEPGVTKLDFGDDGRLSFSVEIEVMPEFELEEWRGIELKKRVYKASEADLTKAIEELREEAADLVADDTEGREVRDGDIVSVDIEGTYFEGEGESHGHAHDPIAQDDVTIEIGAAGVIEEFNDNLRGMKVGDEREFRVAYPTQFPNPKLAGHTVDYKVRLVAIRTKDVPAFDDAFVKEHGEGMFESADQWTTAIRDSLSRQAARRTEEEAHESVIDALIDANNFPVPDAFVMDQAKQRVERMARSFEQQGLDPRTMRLDWEKVIAGAKESATRDVRAAFIIDRIAERERVEVSDEEVDAEIKHIAEEVNQAEAQVRARLTKDGSADTIRNRIRHRKVLELVAQAARTTVEEVEGVNARPGVAEADERLEVESATGSE